MKTEYTAWAVQVLRDGEWVIESPWWDLREIRQDAREQAKDLRHSFGKTARVRKVKVTVEDLGVRHS